MSEPQCMPQGAYDALMKWEAANGVVVTDDFNTISKEGEDHLRNKLHPWRKDPEYFKKCFVSALALCKMALHAKTGNGNVGVLSGSGQDNWIEVMGMFMGHVIPNAFVVRDSFALPGVASEASVSITEEGMKYLIDYKVSARETKRPDYPCGWYHSHPGLGLFLSGTDVIAQNMCQLAYEPFIALVIDPVRTIAVGKVNIKAFRVYPEGYEPKGGRRLSDEDSDVAAKWVKELGVYAKRFYEVPMTIYKTKEDDVQLKLLWAEYWVGFLSSSPLTTTAKFLDERLQQLQGKLKEAAKGGVQITTRRGARAGSGGGQDTAGALSRAAERASQQMLMGALGIAVKSATL